MSLQFVPLDELRRIRTLDADPVERAHAFADANRINTLYMIARAGSGHIGTSFSCMDILAWLHLEVLTDKDIYFSSKGHDAPALYATLIALERLPFERIHGLRRIGGLPGHPDVLTTPQVHTNTGSLGMGISKAKGFAHAARLAGRRRRLFVLTGDGELQEGQFWESLQGAVNNRLDEITLIVDHNKLQSDTFVAKVSDLGDLPGKIAAFGWAVARCDGNDLRDVSGTLEQLRCEGGPKALVADTLKGAGVTFMEPHELPHSEMSLYGFHSGAPSADDYARGTAQLAERLNSRLERLGESAVRLQDAEAAAKKAPGGKPQGLIPAYAEALRKVGEEDERVIVLDADLMLDCGLIPFREQFPARFYECGIAEQDMVSQAGSMALAGHVPIVHSFACFLSTRPNEQIYNNATEGTKVIYVGSLVGLVPGGPGHSHQSVRDIAALGAVPGMALIEPWREEQVGQALDWAVASAPGPVYIRLVSVPWELGFDLPDLEPLVEGRGQTIREGADALLVTAGPVMVSQACGAAEILAGEGIQAGIVALPWLRGVDGAWLAEVAGERPLFCIDNHYLAGGQGEAVLAALAAAGAPTRVKLLGVDRVPESGTNGEVLAAHELSADGIASQVRTGLPSRV